MTPLPLWKKLVCLALLLAEGAAIYPQSTDTSDKSAGTNTASQSVFFDTSGFPQWAKDLHRAEVIAFGAVPFAILLTGIGYDTYRYFSHGRDMRYAPWPLKPAGAVERTNEEQTIMISIAAGAVVAVALADYIIEVVKRYKKKKAERRLSPGTPIIIRKPAGEKEDAPEEAP